MLQSADPQLNMRASLSLVYSVIDIADCEPPRRAAKRGLGPRLSTHTRLPADSHTKPYTMWYLYRISVFEHGHEHEHRVGRSAAARDTKESFRAQAA